MSSNNDEIKTYLINHGFSRTDVRNMSEKELLETFTVLRDSDDVSKDSYKKEQRLPKKVNDKPTNIFPKKINQKPTFNKQLENGGLTDEEALRAALQESIDSQSNAPKVTSKRPNKNNSDNNSNNFFDLINKTIQFVHDTILDQPFFPNQQVSSSSSTNKSKSPPPTQQNNINRNANKESNVYYYNDFMPQKEEDIGSLYENPSTPNENDFYPQTQFNDFYPQTQFNDFDQKPQHDHVPKKDDIDDLLFSSDNESDDFNNSSKIIQRQNEEIKRLEQEVAQKEREENEKKLIEEEENNVKEACQVSLADEIIYLLNEIPPEPQEPKSTEEKRKVVSIAVMNDRKRLERRFNDSDKGIYVYAWVAGTTLDSDEKLYLDKFELKMPMGNILDKNMTLGEQKLHGKVCFIVSELDE